MAFFLLLIPNLFVDFPHFHKILDNILEIILNF